MPDFNKDYKVNTNIPKHFYEIISAEDAMIKKDERLKKEYKEFMDELKVEKVDRPVRSPSRLSYNLKSVTYHPITAKIKYPHIALGTFAKAFRDYIHYNVYSGFQSIIFGAYNKYIQTYIQRMRYSENEERMPIDIGFPIFSYTFEIEGTDEKLDYFWRNTTWLPGVAKAAYEPFYKDEDCTLRIVFRRLKGNINANIYCNSQAESLDIQMAMYDGFRGLNSYSAVNIRAMTILPDQFLFTDYKGKRFSKVLSSNKITKSFIPAVNNTHYYIYNNHPAIINLSALNNSHQYYGATNLPEYSLTGSFNFELEVPSYVLCMCKPNFVGIELDCDVNYKYEDNKIEQAITYITGKRLAQADLEVNTSDFNIISYENGWMIDNKALHFTEEMLFKEVIVNEVTQKEKEVTKSKLPFYSLFDNPSWHYKNRDIVVFVLYPGGIIRIPFDHDFSRYNDDGDIIIDFDLFNVEDFIEFFVFKLNKDIEFE